MTTPAVIVTTPDQLDALVSSACARAVDQVRRDTIAALVPPVRLSARQMGQMHGITAQGWRERVKRGDAPAPDGKEGASDYWDLRNVVRQNQQRGNGLGNGPEKPLAIHDDLAEKEGFEPSMKL